ncbi:MAG: HAMP domain-containing protein [Deltaproteobacteria bacterium]|nr:HAMP domain-containing protein [Deltaproteobacteria bacterium]
MEGLGFKRNFVVPGLVLGALELALIGWPIFPLFELSADQRTLVLRAAGPLVLGALLLWHAAQVSWLAPVQRAIGQRRKGEPITAAAAEAAYRALGRFPIRALWLRTVLWVAVGIAIGVLLAHYSDFAAKQAITLVSMVAESALVVNVVRAAWYARLFRKLRTQLFPAIEPLRQLGDRYFPRLFLVAILTSSAAVLALIGFVYYLLPIKLEEYLHLQTYLPGAIMILTGAWYLHARHVKKPVDVYLAQQFSSGERRYDTSPDPSAVAAYRAAQAMPYQLAAARVVSWTVVAALLAVTLRTSHEMEFDNAVLMLGAAVVITVGSAIYEAVWHRDTMRPLLVHLSVRHRLPVREIRTMLSLRAKLLISFGGLVFFACGLSLCWGFIQYKKLATSFVKMQAQLKLDWVRSEVQGGLAQADERPNPEMAWDILQKAGIGASADDAVYYYVPIHGGKTLSAGGGQEGAPRLPWHAVSRLRKTGRGTVELSAHRLSGNYQRLAIEWKGERVDLGSVAVLYPGYRGRGPGIHRPLSELLLFFFVLFGACAGIVILTVREFTTPIRQLEQRADEMARGELSRPVTSGGEGDEVGRLTLAIEEMRRALREKLRSTEEVNLDLEREVQRRTADLARKNRELAEALDKLQRAQSQLVRSEKMASIGQLVAGIAHEINNPVNAVVNTAGPLSEAIEEIATRRDPSETERLSEEIRDMVRVIQRGARRTKEIVQALHNYSRTDDERIVEFDLNRGLDDSLELLRHHLKGGIEVDRRYGDVGRIKAHAGQVNQVFMNLLTNAAQALTRRDGAKITVVTERRGEQVFIQIIDNGPGIPAEILPRIWDPFFTTKEVGQGTGLGLSIVHGIVERHGGNIEVESEVGKGTTFTVTLPISSPALEGKGTAVANLTINRT